MKYDFKNSLGRIINELFIKLNIYLESSFKDEGFNFSHKEWLVISILYNSKNISQSDIKNFLGDNKVMVTRIIKKLEDKDLIIRKNSTVDNRYNIVELTNAGKILYKQLVKYAEFTLETAYSNLQEEEIQNLINQLNKITANLGNYKLSQ